MEFLSLAFGWLAHYPGIDVVLEPVPLWIARHKTALPSVIGRDQTSQLRPILRNCRPNMLFCASEERVLERLVNVAISRLLQSARHGDGSVSWAEKKGRSCRWSNG